MEQIYRERGLIKEQEAWMPTAEVCRKYGLSQRTFYKFKSKYGGMDVSDAAQLKALEDENDEPCPAIGPSENDE